MKIKYLIIFIIHSIRSRNLQRTYNSTAYIYDSLFFKQQNNFSNILCNHITNYSYNKNAILDIGCGTGILTENLVKISKDITAIDYSIEMLKIAKRKVNANKVKYICGDIQTVLLNKHFDAICCLGVLSHINKSDFKKLLLKYKYLLKKDGKIIIGITPFPWNKDCAFKLNLKNKIFAFIYNLFQKWNKTDERRANYSPENINKISSECGLNSETFYYANFILLVISNPEI